MAEINSKTILISVALLLAVAIGGYFIFGDFSDSTVPDPDDPLNPNNSEYPEISGEVQYNEPPESLTNIYRTHSSAVQQVEHSYEYSQALNGSEQLTFEVYSNFEEKELYKDSEFSGQDDSNLRVERYVDGNRAYVRQSSTEESETSVETTNVDEEQEEFIISQTLSGSQYTGLTITHSETVETETGDYYVYDVGTADESGDWNSHTGTIVLSDTGVLVEYDVTSTLESGEEYEHTYSITSTNPEFEVPLWVEGV
jgi:hypothetical protein